VQSGQVAFQELAVEVGELAGCGRRGCQEDAEAGDRPDSGGHAACLGAGCQPPPAPALGQILQPGLADLPEADRRGRAGDAQVAQPPDISRVFDVPAAADGERLDALAGVQGKGAPSASSSPAWPELLPGGFGLVQQRCHPGGGQVADDPLDRGRDERRLLLIPAALKHVLHLQPQRPGQLPQVDALGATPSVLAGDGELVRVGPPVLVPPHVMAAAEQRRRARPQVAVAHPAGSRPG